MILADKIINERKKNGWSQEELAEKLDVSRQSVSKWEGAQAVPDIQKIILMAGLFGVTTDYLLKDEYGPDDRGGELSQGEFPEDSRRRVSLEEASLFIRNRLASIPSMALAVVLCVLSPVPMLFLLGLSVKDGAALSSEKAAMIGLSVLVVMVAIAVAIFIRVGMRLEPYGYLSEEMFETEYGVTGMAKERLAAYKPVYTRIITLGVIACIVSPLPLIVTSIIWGSGFVALTMVCVLLMLVAAGVYGFVYAGMTSSTYRILLCEGEYTELGKKVEGRIRYIPLIYWMSVTAIFFAYSFLFNGWNISWVIWPIAGVLFVIVMAVARMCAEKDRN